jgi:hypothetical protein
MTADRRAASLAHRIDSHTKAMHDVSASLRPIGTALAALASALALAGCTTYLRVSPVGTSAIEGVTYYLPAKRFKVEVDFIVVDCLPDAGQHRQPALMVEVAEEQFADTSKPFVLSYAELSKMTKTTRFEVALTEAGTLSSVNAAIKDQSGEILAASASAAFSAARAAALVGAQRSVQAVPNGTPGSAKPPCQDTLGKRIANLRTAEEAVRKAELADLDLGQARAARQKAAAAMLQAQGKLEAAKQAKDPAAVKDAEAKLKDAQAAFEAAHAVVARLGEDALPQARARLAQRRQELTASAAQAVVPGSARSR